MALARIATAGVRLALWKPKEVAPIAPAAIGDVLVDDLSFNARGGPYRGDHEK